ncbi:DUF5938 domain-containing protein [Pseudonocardia sp. T1-2H]|uniref:DUF5938 domain-containing protein n=1 Tax=Pseudonocardia sp. T1-2H TaxID=3128899 RepID=UPI0031011029
MAANVALETPGLDTLDILVLWKGYPTFASAQTIFTILKADWYHLVENQYVAWDHKATRECVVPGSQEPRSPSGGAAWRIPCGSPTTPASRT